MNIRYGNTALILVGARESREHGEGGQSVHQYKIGKLRDAMRNPILVLKYLEEKASVQGYRFQRSKYAGNPLWFAACAFGKYLTLPPIRTDEEPCTPRGVRTVREGTD